MHLKHFIKFVKLKITNAHIKRQKCDETLNDGDSHANDDHSQTLMTSLHCTACALLMASMHGLHGYCQQQQQQKQLSTKQYTPTRGAAAAAMNSK